MFALPFTILIIMIIRKHLKQISHTVKYTSLMIQGVYPMHGEFIIPEANITRALLDRRLTLCTNRWFSLKAGMPVAIVHIVQ
jgi:hypothetical protein